MKVFSCSRLSGVARHQFKISDVRKHWQSADAHGLWFKSIDIGFILLARQVLHGLSFTDAYQLRQFADMFIATSNPQTVTFQCAKREGPPAKTKYGYASISNEVLGTI